MIHGELLINGFFFGGPCESSIGKQVVRTPYDGSIVGSAAEGSKHELQHCVDAAAEAFATWRFSSPESRKALLTTISQEIAKRREELAALMCAEIAKPITLALGEVDRASVVFALAAEEVDNLRYPASLTPDKRAPNYTAEIMREPRGVVFGIVPYNWPINLAAHKLAPAVATGSTIVIKTSPQAPLSTMQIVRLLHECGMPPGVVNVWNGPTPAVQGVMDDPHVKTISFTGSDKVGWALKQRYWDRHVVLECGGDAHVIVLPDADLADAAKKVYAGAFAYAGQICISIQHALVHQSIFEPFSNALVEMAQNDTLRDPTNSATLSSAMIDSAAADRVEGLIDEAKSMGSTILVGGERSGNVVSPCVLTDVPAKAKLRTEEAFGPVLVLHRFSCVDEAIAHVNASKFGIHCGIFGANRDEMRDLARRVETAGVIINDVPTTRFDALPYGGVRQSGFGREGVRYAMEEFTELKSIVERL